MAVVWCRWVDPTTQGKLAGARERMIAVKDVFDSLDEDGSGSIEEDEIGQLAEALGVQLAEVWRPSTSIRDTALLLPPADWCPNTASCVSGHAGGRGGGDG